MRIAEAPSSATMTVMPAPSSASVSSRSVSGESSTTSATSRFLGSVIIGVQRLQGGHVLVEVEAVDQPAHLRDEIGMFRVFAADLVELDLDGADISDLAEPDQFLDMVDRRSRAGVRLPARRRDLIRLVSPFELEQLADRFQQARNIDRLHQVAVVKRLCQRRAMRFQRA